ncbi:MAG: hypothetical protein QX191_06635 [Methylococcaceae bacterium]
MGELIGYGLIAFFCLAVALTVTFVFRQIVWWFSPIFFFLNHMQWFLYNPLRFMFKNPNSEFGRRFFILFHALPLVPIYWFFIHFVTTPLRIINSLYFDILVYWSVMLDDSLQEVFIPKRGEYRRLHGFKYFSRWFFAFPYRLLVFIFRSIFIIIDGILMFGISVVSPALTMYHGTQFNDNLTKIVQDGRWRVGDGDHAGLGIYFAIKESVARHYSPGGEDRGIAILRVTPTFTRNQVTLKKHIRDLVGNDGKKLSQKLKFPYATIEHWRTDMGGWWEYCLVQPGKSQKYIRTWRIRPIAVLKSDDGKITRIWGGMRPFCYSFSNFFAGVMSWGIMFVTVSIIKHW